MDKSNTQKLIEETIHSMDGAAKAEPAPFLITRIRARMNSGAENASYWERAIEFLTSPAFAFPALAIVLVVNFWMMQSSSVADNLPAATENQYVVNDGYSISSPTSLFDIENNP